ncbi:nucleoside triphosphate pyrophosphohydrolase [Nocardioides piscis]|uniref:Nucleoside triphosphate pyrophosphohydrolase n=1 Tax=Nocardioides piscis TaxID=2714938 RepID=A0A6G7YHF6_9ACTN|nr:nucleoside triphosphate pyrophosphohydrolase [Nocardioides piscis]QIK76169.1 nucleoside triphosphate pyrophosphohydrolase [Nocardioides piscis]
MGKLVRDKIPEIIRASGTDPDCRVLEADEYLPSLFAKLFEESEELRAAPRAHQLDELADVYEVLRALAAATNHSMSDIELAAQRKRAERGGFEDRIWLERW